MSKLDIALRDTASPVVGAACYTYNPVFVDIAARLGYKALWIEMEHAHITFAQAADLCRIATGQGLLTMIRIPDSRRENVLKAAECGPDIIDLPMANSPSIVQELVHNARYSPEGGRGFFGASRAVNYSIGQPLADEQRTINGNLCLMIQIETREAVDQVSEICAVPGFDAIFLGPGDMSASLGVTGEVNHPLVLDAFAKAISAAKLSGKRVAMACNPADVAQWASKGVELFFCGSDIACMKIGAQQILSTASGL